jgi:hypothetical protein
MITYKIKNVPSGATYWRVSILTPEGLEWWSVDAMTPSQSYETYSLVGEVASMRYIVYDASDVYLEYNEIADQYLTDGLAYVFDYASGVLSVEVKKGSISGTINSGGTALSGVVVAIYSHDDTGRESPIKSTSTDSSGNYTLADIPFLSGHDTGTGFNLRCTKTNYGVMDMAVTLIAGQTVSKDITMTADTPTTGGVTGTVKNSAGTVMSGVTVAIYYGDDTAFEAPIKSMVTGANGVFTLAGIPLQYGDGFVLSGYKTGLPETKIQVTLVAGSNITQNITMATTPSVGAVAGKVSDSAGAPIAGVLVTITDKDGTVSTITATTDASGNYGFTGMPISGNDYHLDFSKTGYVSRTD